jgi:threonine dehydrogenase-like Zn-dependent dehydrogenase
VPLPNGCSKEAAIFAGDTLASGFAAAERGGVGPGDVVAVVGGGVVGQMASLACQAFGTAAVIVVDPVAERRRLSARLGGVGATPASARSILDDLTEGRGADVVVEAVGGQEPMDAAMTLVRRGGTVVSIGAHFAPTWPLPVARAFAEELCVRFAIGDSIRLRDRIFPLLTIGVIDPAAVVTERVSLQAAPDAYRRLAEHAAVKVLIDVWE